MSTISKLLGLISDTYEKFKEWSIALFVGEFVDSSDTFLKSFLNKR
jgi:hypothetical protein